MCCQGPSRVGAREQLEKVWVYSPALQRQVPRVTTLPHQGGGSASRLWSVSLHSCRTGHHGAEGETQLAPIFWDTDASNVVIDVTHRPASQTSHKSTKQLGDFTHMRLFPTLFPQATMPAPPSFASSRQAPVVCITELSAVFLSEPIRRDLIENEA